ncbi:hypothetical protein E1166_01670 [Micromonospora sp. KC213]|nr:hypothetical protein E1166_01670 [Micromonospora sp. KC213]
MDPQATTAARKLLCYLYSQYGNHILSGQQESTWIDGPDHEINYIYRHTGKYPAIRSLDMGDSPTFGSRVAAWWRSGGIPMVGYHMGSPAQDSDGYAGSPMNADINAALTPGTADNRRLLQRLDARAPAQCRGRLLRGVPVTGGHGARTADHPVLAMAARPVGHRERGPAHHPGRPAQPVAVQHLRQPGRRGRCDARIRPAGRPASQLTRARRAWSSARVTRPGARRLSECR